MGVNYDARVRALFLSKMQADWPAYEKTYVVIVRNHTMFTYPPQKMLPTTKKCAKFSR